MMVLVPLWTNFVIRVYAWMMILRTQGVINGIIGWLFSIFGAHFTPLEMLYTPGAVLVGMVYEFLPFMILLIYTSLEKVDNSLFEAAADLGANPFETFLRVTLPLSMPGVVAGTLLTFIPAAGDYVNAAILGNPQTKMLGNVIDSKFFKVVDYPTAAALSFMLMFAILVLVSVYIRRSGTDELV